MHAQCAEANMQVMHQYLVERIESSLFWPKVVVPTVTENPSLACAPMMYGRCDPSVVTYRYP